MILDILFWLLIVACFVLSFVVLFRPILPGLPFIWLGVLIYHLGVSSGRLHFSFWLILTAMTIIIVALDILTSQVFIKESNGSKWSERISVVAIIVGSFVVPPWGLFLVPFGSVFVTEKVQGKSWLQALKVAVSTVLSFLVSLTAKAILQLVTIVIFFIYVIV